MGKAGKREPCSGDEYLQCLALLLHWARTISLFWQCTEAPLLTWLQALCSNKLQIGNQVESLSVLCLSACKIMQLEGRIGMGKEWEKVWRKEKGKRSGGLSSNSGKAEYWLVVCVCVFGEGGHSAGECWFLLGLYKFLSTCKNVHVARKMNR